MKKIVSFFAIVLLLSASTNAYTDPANTRHITRGPKVPVSVLTAFDNTVTVIIHSLYGSGSSFDANGITWDHVQGLFVAGGDVMVVAGGGTGIHVAIASYRHNGENIQFLYSPIP